MSRVATVLEPLNLRKAPSTEAGIIGVLAVGAEVTITAQARPWRQVETALGQGYVHGDFIAVNGSTPVNEEPDGLDPEIPDIDRDEDDDRTGMSGAERFYTVVPGDSISVVGAKLGIPWQEIADANGLTDPFTVWVNQVIRIPAVRTRVNTAIRILNPIGPGATTFVTSSSNQGHHRPYGGDRSCDLALPGSGVNPGGEARFHAEAPDGKEVRGVVKLIGFACASGQVIDGGRKVELRLEVREPGGEWRDTNAWLLYAHLDPVLVDFGDQIEPGTVLGKMGRSDLEEYDSRCARGSHIHVEATRATSVVNVNEQLGLDAIMEIAI